MVWKVWLQKQPLIIIINYFSFSFGDFIYSLNQDHSKSWYDNQVATVGVEEKLTMKK